ncbi:hypothetical protein C2S53_019299 [Perilla frutescens var. hirtella]|uniref:Uncharacterized protein n=1 Tax=Perilla frutescens var. hirtella TaxID=608512 RepID=A0AAD4P320_PERFH|nr:hypothetical protein C2S53_019299 [Perilla frutescens var. hirtella]
MNGAVEVRRPNAPAAADISVFEFGSVAASADKVTLAGYCPVSDELEPCRWEILPASGTDAPQFRVVIFDFRFLALLAVGGSLAGSVLCFLNGCVYIFDAYNVNWSSCIKGIHSGQMVLRLVEAIASPHSRCISCWDCYVNIRHGLLWTIHLKCDPNVAPAADRSLMGSSLFGMFALKERPTWMKISSLDELKTKVGHVIVILLW